VRDEFACIHCRTGDIDLSGSTLARVFGEGRHIGLRVIQGGLSECGGFGGSGALLALR